MPFHEEYTDMPTWDYESEPEPEFVETGAKFRILYPSEDLNEVGDQKPMYWREHNPFPWLAVIGWLIVGAIVLMFVCIALQAFEHFFSTILYGKQAEVVADGVIQNPDGSMLCYDPETGKWGKCAEAPIVGIVVAIAAIIAVTLGGYIAYRYLKKKKAKKKEKT